MSERIAMSISELRKSLGMSLAQFAEAIGVTSKGYASDIENGARPSVRVALKIEELSAGQIDAASLNPDVGLVRSSSAQGEAA